MRTETLVRGSADIVRIVNLSPGDVYKRLTDNNYGPDKWIAHYGVVQTVDFNGEDAMVTAIEFADEYDRSKPSTKTFGADADLKLFAATPDEVRLALEQVIEKAEAKVRQARTELDNREREFRLVVSITDTVELIQSPATRNTLEPVIEADPYPADFTEDMVDTEESPS